MAKTEDVTVMAIGTDWQASWPDSYRLVCKNPDRSRSGSFRTETTVYFGEMEVLTSTIDLLNSRDRQAFNVEASGVNGLPPASWDRRLVQVYRRIVEQDTRTAVNVWDQAATAEAFCAQEETELDATVKDFLVTGGITIVAAPRGSGKSVVATFLGVSLAQGGLFRMERLAHQRVLLLDRDNPQGLVRERLRHAGAQSLTTFKILTRETAPPLTEKDAWAHFPAEDYDVIIVDSLSAFTEGVSEKEGKQTQEFLATLKNLAARGVAILVLANTNKAGTNIRGRGEQSDAVDIVYEARNMTGWEPTHGPCWWESLPDAGEQAWQQNTTRRVRSATLRIGFIPTKFRLGIWPEPFVLEVDTTTTPWSIRDITTLITQEGIQAAQEQRSAERQKLDAAAWALADALRPRPTDDLMLKREAEDFLRSQGLKVKQARNLLDNGYNQDVHPEGLWVLCPISGKRGHGIGIKLAEKNTVGVGGVGVGVRNNGNSFSTSKEATQKKLIADVGSTGHVPNTVSVSTSLDADDIMTDFGREPHGIVPKSAQVSSAEMQDETIAGVFRKKSFTPAENMSPSEGNMSPLSDKETTI